MKVDRRKILIVDDAGPMVVLCVNILQALGFLVRTALSGETALELIRNELFDLTIVDYRMPGMSGFELLGRAKALRPEMPFMLITAYGTPDIVEDATDLGFTTVLLKPFTRAQLGAAVETALAPRPGTPTRVSELGETP